MSESARELESLIARGYQHGFVTEIDADTVAPGLNEDVVRLISRKKQEPAFLTEWRLKALRHWLTMREPHWAHVRFAPIDYQAISYYSAPRAKKDGPKSLDEVDPKLLETYEKLGVPLHERARLAGVAVDAVFDSVSVATTFKERLAAAGVVFCPFSEAVRAHPELIERYLGSVVPYTDNFFATLHAAVVELIALDDAYIKYSTVQNWYPGDAQGVGGIYNFVTKRGECRGRNAHISWTQVETGSAITWKYPSCVLRGAGSIGEFYS